MSLSFDRDLTTRLYQGLSRIPADWPLCLLDGKKVPQGIGWQQKPLTPAQMKEAVTDGWIVDKADGTQYRCYPKGYGLITGSAIAIENQTHYLMAVDQDGASAATKILELSGGEQLPHTVAFTSNRPGRCQFLFLVPQEYANFIKTRKFSTGIIGDDGKGEQLEFRWSNLQSCLPPSVHPSTGEYVWLPGCAPDEIQVAIAPLWILEQMLVDSQELENSSERSPQPIAPNPPISGTKIPVQPTLRTYHQQQQWTDVDWALSYLAALSPSRSDHYEQWCTVGMILKSIDDSLLYEWDHWSRQSSKYKPGECEKKWKSFQRTGVGIGTLAYWAKQDGWCNPFEKKRFPSPSSSGVIANNHFPQKFEHSQELLPRETRNSTGNSNTEEVGKSRNSPLSEISLSARIDEILDRNLDLADELIALGELANRHEWQKRDFYRIVEQRRKERGLEDNAEQRKQDLEHLEQLETQVDKFCFEDLFYASPQTATAFNEMCKVNPKLFPLYFLGILPVVGSLIGIKGKLQVPNGGTHKPINRMILVGESSEGKSIHTSILLDPLNTLQRKLLTLHSKQMEAYQTAVLQWEKTHIDDRGTKPRKDEYVTVSDALLYITEYTREGIVSNHADNPNGLLIFQEEAIAIETSQNMYRKGKGDDRQFINNLADGKGIHRTLASGRRVSLDETAVSFFGGGQPLVMQKAMGDLSDADGQWARYDFVVAPYREIFTNYYQPTVDVFPLLLDLYEKAFSTSAIAHHLSPEALKLAQRFTTEMERIKYATLQGGLRSVYGKAAGALFRYAVTLHWMNCLLAGTEITAEIPAIAIEKAIKLKRIFLRHMEIVRSWGQADLTNEIGLPPIYRQIQGLCQRLCGKTDVLTARMVQQARLPVFLDKKGKIVSAAEIIKVFRDMAALDKGKLVQVKRSQGLLIRSVIESMRNPEENNDSQP